MEKGLNARFMFWTTIVVLLIVGINFLMDFREQRLQARAELKEKARVIIQQFMAMREFIACNQDRINYDSQGHFEFKHLNPAAVGRGVGQIFNQWTDYSLKQTRLYPRNAANAPNAFETDGLRRFVEDPSLREYAQEYITATGKTVFCYMVPMNILESCLPCHGEPAGQLDIAGYPKEGYKLGDLGGALSVAIPMDNFTANLQSTTLRHLAFFVILATAILAAVSFLARRLVISPLGKLKAAAVRLGRGELGVDLTGLKSYGEVRDLARQLQEMARQLKELYENLEEKVEQRTLALREANRELQAQREALHRANEELAQASELKSRFLASMSHELRTPLTSIMALSDLLLERLPPNHGQHRADLEEIKKSGENLLELINNLLDLAKIEAGRHQLNLDLADPVDILIAVEKTTGPLAQKQGLTLEVKMEDVPLIYCDAEKIRRVLLNLVGNAIKFTPAGGQVKLLATGKPETGEVIFQVKDNGIGIAPQDQQLIFEPFRQVDSSDSRKYRGTGLGLSLANELVEMHGGRISVDSEPGRGSTFTVSLPTDPRKLIATANGADQ
ncbi:histidine kinase [Clostridiales bacterium PH28_bin88]|nr:histidine kinase [Clostridiales bacterium PH28_bin88]